MAVLLSEMVNHHQFKAKCQTRAKYHSRDKHHTRAKLHTRVKHHTKAKIKARETLMLTTTHMEQILLTEEMP